MNHLWFWSGLCGFNQSWVWIFLRINFPLFLGEHSGIRDQICYESRPETVSAFVLFTCGWNNLSLINLEEVRRGLCICVPYWSVSEEVSHCWEAPEHHQAPKPDSQLWFWSRQFHGVLCSVRIRGELLSVWFCTLKFLKLTLLTCCTGMRWEWWQE